MTPSPAPTTNPGDSALSADDVRWCYSELLLREPESEAIVEAHLQHRSWQSLVQAFLTSDEYVQRHHPRHFHTHPLAFGPVEVLIDERELAAAMAKVKRAWTHLGEQRPHHSVLTKTRYLPANLVRHLPDFWASGELEAAHVAAMVAHHGVAADASVCTEWGCGVGRVTAGLAARFSQVHAYDISASHLALARDRLQSLGVKNVQLQLSSDTVLPSLQPCDVLYTRIVLQHNPPPLMLAMVQRLLQALRPGGLAIFQLPTFALGYRFRLAEWLAAPEVLDMEMHCLPQCHVFLAIAQAGCTLLEVLEDDSPEDHRYISNVFVVRR